MQRGTQKGDEVTSSSSSTVRTTAAVTSASSEVSSHGGSNRSKNISRVPNVVEDIVDRDTDNRVGIFRVRESPSRLTPNSKQELLANLGVSSDSTEPETISVDLPTITVSEDDLHDSFSDLDTESDADLEDLEKIGREMAAAPSPYDMSIVESTTAESPATVSNRKPPAGPSGHRAAMGGHTSSHPSLSDAADAASPTRSHSIREKVKQFSGKVKNVSGRVKGIIVNNLRRSHDDISSIATRSSSPTTSATTVLSGVDESSKKLELKKRELDLKRKEKELKELEAAKKKEDDKLRKLRKDEEDKLNKWSQELKKKEKESFDRIKAKEELLSKREKEIADREALLARKQNDFEAMCRKVECQIEEERKIIQAQRKANADKDGISLRASSPVYDNTPVSSSSVTRVVSGSVSQLNIDEPNKPPPRSVTSTAAGKKASSPDDARRKLPPPPRPPLPPPVVVTATPPPSSSVPTTSSSSFSRDEPIYARILPKPPKVTTSSSISQASSHDTSMKTALSAPYNQSSTLFRISPASSNESTLYCSDFVDIPLDDDATLRGSVTNSTFDAKSFYRMIVTRWRATHPRRVLKETPPPRLSGHKYSLYTSLFSRPLNRSSVNVATGAPVHHLKRPCNVHSSKKGITYYSNPPSRQPIYQVVNSHSNNYRMQRRKEFYTPMHENAYDELIFPIGSGGLTSAGPAISFYHQPLPPPRVKRNKHLLNTQYRRLPSSRCDVVTPIDTDCSTTGGGYSLPTTTTGSSSSLNALMVSEDESRETITN